MKSNTIELRRILVMAFGAALIAGGWQSTSAGLIRPIRAVDDDEAIGIVGGEVGCCQQTTLLSYSCGSDECCGTGVGISCGGGAYSTTVGGLGQFAPDNNTYKNCYTCVLCNICTKMSVPTVKPCQCSLSSTEKPDGMNVASNARSAPVSSDEAAVSLNGT